MTDHPRQAARRCLVEQMEYADRTAKSTADLTNPVHRVDKVKSDKDAVGAGGLSQVTYPTSPRTRRTA